MNPISYKSILLAIFMVLVTASLHAQNFNAKKAEVHKDGKSLKYPFSGGFDAPQFNEIDLDLDGVNDLVAFDRSGNVIVPFKYTGLGNEVVYEYAPKYVHNFPVLINWVLMRDYNNDGIKDLFVCPVEAPPSGIEVYTGKIEGGKLAFELKEFDEGEFNILYYLFGGKYYNIYVSLNDIPEIIDVEGDGDLDILTFDPDGSYMYYYKNTAVEDGLGLDEFHFVLEEVCWGRFYEGGFDETIDLSTDPSKCYVPFTNEEEETRHSGSTVSAFDQNNDGDMELIIGDLTFNGLSYLENGGSPESAWVNEIDQSFPVYDVPASMPLFLCSFHIDLDKDGDNDMLACPNNKFGAENLNNVWYYNNLGNAEDVKFEFHSNDLFAKDMIDLGTGSAPCFIDYNADGLFDLLVGNLGFSPTGVLEARLQLYENIGTASVPSFELVDPDYLTFSNYQSEYFYFSPTVGDLDNDGDDDLLVGTQTGYLIYLENIGGIGESYVFDTPVFKYMNIKVGENTHPSIVDLNKDGLSDLVIGERNGNQNIGGGIGSLNYLQNVGSIGNPMFVSDPQIMPNTNTLGLVNTTDIDVLDYSGAPVFVELDNDSLVLISGSESGRIKLYKGIEGNFYDSFEKLENNFGNFRIGLRSTPALADIDNDGFYELVTGNNRGGLNYFNTIIHQSGTISNIAEINHDALKIYPNPSTGILNLEWDHLAKRAVQVVSIDGIILQNIFVENKNLVLNMENYAPGIYIIRTQNSNNWQSNRVVVY